MFVDKNEHGIAGIGQGYIESMLQNGNLSNNCAVVTDKRLYFDGDIVYVDGIKSRKVQESKVVDLKDVTGTSFILNKELKRKIGIALMIVSAVLWILMCSLIYSDGDSGLQWMLFQGDEYELALVGIIGGIYLIGIIGLIMWITSGKSYMIVEYAGGNIKFALKGVSGDNIKSFIDTVRKAKSDLDNTEVKVIQEEQENTSKNDTDSKDIMTELKMAKSLLEEGLVTKDEFDSIKKKILK